MNKVNIKPMSVNQAWQGKKFKSPKYKAWREQMSFMLPATAEVPEGRLMLIVTFGTSSKLSDVDNLLKPFIDSLQDKYGFNDRNIYLIISAKEDVPKGSEFIQWELFNVDGYCDFMDMLSTLDEV